MKRRLTVVAALASLVLVASACEGGGSTARPSLAPRESAPPPVPTGPGSAAAAREALCKLPPTPVPSLPATQGPTPPAIAKVESEVQQVRGLKFETKVPVEPVSQSEMAQRVKDQFDASAPVRYLARRSLAWQTIGVIAPGASVRQQLEQFQTGQVVGYYVPESGELVYLGSSDPTPLSQLALAHELTHAVDDQHFNLDRVDQLGTDCQDELQMAALGAIEGSAQFFSTKVATTFFTPDQLVQMAQEAGGQQLPQGVSPFVEQLELWPYDAGQAFITQLDSRGGTKLVNQALQHFPVSTEQIIHPELWPNDLPTPVDITDLGRKLGPGWTDLDVMDVGEAWLQIMLRLRLDPAVADAASTGWDGGLYRAWQNGPRVALVLSTVWDTPEDARQFADAIGQWIGKGAGSATVLPVDGNGVRVLFASDGTTLSALQSAAG